ncbi:MAG: hypothetical protein PHV32_04840 [Eubacteriales bacterium]|nr:hypothetical protein [Eubacteriales bacterium]
MVNSKDENYEVIKLFGQEALFTNSRIDRETVPQGVYCYDIRHGDDDSVPCSLEPSVFVNHMGTVICGVDFGMVQDSYIPIGECDMGFEGYSEDLDSYMNGWEKVDVPFPAPIAIKPYTPSVPQEPESADELEL